jgi:type IV pilus assembly protein PilC
MPKFKYAAVDAGDLEVTGMVEGPTAAAAGLSLLAQGLRVKQIVQHKGLLQLELTRKRVPRRDLMHFSRQLSVFLRAGISVLDALDVVRQETTRKVFAACLADMIEALRAGSTFTAAASAHPEAFPPFYLGVLEAAEATGNLDRALDEVADYIDREVEAKRKVQSALFYPACVFLMSIATVVVLTTFVLPRFAKFFEELNATLPLPTRMLLFVSDVLTGNWPVIVGGLVALGTGLGLGLRTRRGKDIRDAMLLRMPVLGDLVRGAIIERFCRTLSSMVRSGVSLPDALVITSNGASNAVYRRGLEEVRQSMLQGEGLAQPIARTGLFPGAARQMIRVGEETGTLDIQLETSAKYYERDLDFKITRFTNLFEPAVIIFMGVVVGFVAIALVTAMYGIFNQVNV